MTKKMLIDATHAEETRVVVMDGNRMVDYDYESALRKQLKGSIFLAKVTRVEPSLQAAFVNFGGNRHGFLPFSEIHPDYFRIPVADREALIAAQQAEIEALRAEEEAEDEEEASAQDKSTTAQPEDVPDEEDEVIEEIGGEDQVAPEEELGADAPEPESKPEPEPVADAVPAEKAKAKTKAKDKKKASSEEKAAEEATEESDDNVDGNVAPSKEAELVADDDDSNDVNGNVAAPEAEEDGAQPESNESQGGRERSGGRGRQHGGRGRYNNKNRGGRMPSRSRRSEKYSDDEDGGARVSARRNYKIQEVVKRGQIMLVQVSREERGNKGAAVTTHLSLPGRYCVLMPNSQRAGGVSRKVASFQERRRMREILAELKVPEGMSVIMRTAGVSRTKAEIKRDLDYLLKLWDSIRELTLKSTAPALVHEEGQLIRRAVRDIYGRDVEEIQVAGERGYKTAKEYMKMMIPSHVKRVQLYNDEKIPLFYRYQVEGQISGMSEPTVTLRSGGYLVINPTEALVSIDVNSGRATRERHIEETALQTNLEAAEEVARQLRLRDLGGLVVIDFIDMEDRRNNRRVENRLRDALSTDRARIQMGRISSFGLLEMSRQRLNPSLTEAQFERCPHCKGVGNIRTIDMTAITALRALEEEGGLERGAAEVGLHLPDAVALYILNNKRDILMDIERRYGFRVTICNDESLAPAGFRLEPRTAEGVAIAPLPDKVEPFDKGKSDDGGSSRGPREDGDRQDGRRRRGRRGGRGRGRGRSNDEARSNVAQDSNATDSAAASDAPESDEKSDASKQGGDDGQERSNEQDQQSGDEHRDGRRRRRGGRNRNRNSSNRDKQSSDAQGDGGAAEADGNKAPAAVDLAESDQPSVKEVPAKKSDTAKPRPKAKPKAKKPEKKTKATSEAAAPSNDTQPQESPPSRDYEKVNEPPVSKKKGWWNRLTE